MASAGSRIDNVELQPSLNVALLRQRELLQCKDQHSTRRDCSNDIQFMLQQIGPI